MPRSSCKTPPPDAGASATQRKGRPYKKRFSVKVPLHENHGSCLTDKPREKSIASRLMSEAPVATLRTEPCHRERKQKASAASGLICSYSLMETARQPLVVRAFSHADARQSRSAAPSTAALALISPIRRCKTTKLRSNESKTSTQNMKQTDPTPQNF